MTSRGFASDNYAGAHPEVLAAIAEANGGHQIAYGEDVYTAHLQTVMAQHFGEGVQAFPVFNGTGANVLSLQSVLPRWGAVVCAETAHINTDENAAPERVGGLKLLTVPTTDGKLTPELIDRQAWGWGDEHRAQPLAVSITQTTELGTAYTPGEIRAIADHVHSKGMLLHVDGARIANAAATLGTGLGAFTSEAGVDLLSFGGTKNGLLFGEAVVVMRPDESAAAAALPFLRKLNMQLASKMRFVSAQLIALLEGDLWLRSAQHSNAMAARLAEGVQRPGRRPDHPAGAGQRGVRGPGPGCREPASRALPVLRLEPGHRRGALDVRLRHHRSRRRRLRRRTQAAARRGPEPSLQRHGRLQPPGPPVVLDADHPLHPVEAAPAWHNEPQRRAVSWRSGSPPTETASSRSSVSGNRSRIARDVQTVSWLHVCSVPRSAAVAHAARTPPLPWSTRTVMVAATGGLEQTSWRRLNSTTSLTS